MRIPIDTVLLAINLDQPTGGVDLARNNPDAEDWIAALIAVWQQCGMPVLRVRHEGGGATGIEDGVEAIAATAGDAFLGTGLDERLTSGGHTTLVLCGTPTHGVVSATARHASSLGYRVFVVADACWAAELTDPFGKPWPAEAVHRVALAGLHGAYATVVGARSACEAATLIASRRK